MNTTTSTTTASDSTAASTSSTRPDSGACASAIASANARAPHRSKTIAGLLALVFGWSGAHRMYLGARFWWLYPLIAMPAIGLALAAGGEHWYLHPGFFVASAVVIVVLLEAIVFCLTPDEKWDARINPASGQVSDSGWGAVLIAIAALMLGAMLLVSSLAIGLEAYFESIRSGRR